MILLLNPQETPYESFGKNLVEHLADFVLGQFAPEGGDLQEKRPIMLILFESYIRMVLQIVENDWKEEQALNAFQQLNQYHVMGLWAILEK